MASGSALVPLQLEHVQQEASLLDYSLRCTRGAVYLYCTGLGASSAPTLATLDMLTHCLEPAAHAMPRCNIVPLLPFLGWTPDRLAASLPAIQEVVAAAEHAQECHSLVDQLNAARQQAGLPSLSLTITAGHAAPPPPPPAAETPVPDQQLQPQQPQPGSSSGDAVDGGQELLVPAGACSRVIGDWAGPALQFERVAVGGTFDRLHAGHRLLLAATALVSRRDIFVGITADALLANKKNKELLAGYDERAAAAVGYMQMVNPSAVVVAGPLTDPKEPPLCATDPDFDAIVVSAETLPGAHAINKVREGLGFRPLVIVVIGLIYSRYRAAKLSSTDLREDDAAAGGGGAGGGGGGGGGSRSGSPH